MTEPTTDTTAKIPESCPKCGRTGPEYHYDEVHNELAMHCLCCGFRWSVEPLDRQEQTLLQMEQVRHATLQQMMAPPPLRSPIPGTTAGAPADPVPAYNTHPKIREHLAQAIMHANHAMNLHVNRKKGMSKALGDVLCELRAAEVWL